MRQGEIAEFLLEDQLDHPAFSWPKSLVTWKVSFDEGDTPIYAERDDGHRQPVQLFSEDGELRAAIISGMASGERKQYHLYRGEECWPNAVRIEKAADRVQAENEKLAVTVFQNTQKDGELFLIQDRGSGVCAVGSLCGVDVSDKAVILEAEGPVFADLSVRLRLSGKTEGEYILKLRLTAEMDFVEIRETMKGFQEKDGVFLKVEWKSFAPETRCTTYRGIEPIDAYLQENNRIPMVITPYDSWVSWWDGKSISFCDSVRQISTGIFVRHAEAWDDGKYPLWRFSAPFGIRFYWQEECLQWIFPILDGERCTAAAVFNSDKDRQCSLGITGDGLYGEGKRSPMNVPYIEKEWFWQEWLALDKVRTWTLRWEEKQEEYPRFFPRENFPTSGTQMWYLGPCFRPFEPDQLEKIVYELSNSMNQMIRTGPVSNREFYDWAPIFDMAAPHMTEEQFNRLKAVFAFCAYAFSDECYMPVRKMLAGHPNFLADGRGVAGVAAAMFPAHPDARKWKNEYELAMARNLKYHTRPDVPAWGSKGGRWTENLGCYLFAMLRPANHAQTLLERSFHENVLLYPNLSKVLTYFMQTLSAPVDGVRETPPLGAHCRKPLKPIFDLNLWGNSLYRYDPLLAEQLWYISRPDGPSFEANRPYVSIYQTLAGARFSDISGTRPELHSEKFTGFGYVLRSKAGFQDEMNVDLIQIDDGPNYRWGRAGEGSCGMLLYYADGHRYSSHGPEDAGDENKGDVQACSNFGVLIGHEYHSVGRNDLTNPLYDFEFAQFAQVDANEEVKNFYRSRSVLMSGNDYIVVYDAVNDCQVHGRFSWFNKVDDPFPNIVQLKPGAAFVPSDGGIPIDQPDQKAGQEFIGRYYEGNGDFLTLVSHRPVNCDRSMYTTVRDFGCLVELQGRKDYVFRSASRIRYREEMVGFNGYAGIVRLYGENCAEAAVFSGSMISACGVTLHCRSDQEIGASFSWKHGELKGFIQCKEPTEIRLEIPNAQGQRKLFLDGEAAECISNSSRIEFRVPAGKTFWEWTDLKATPQTPQITGTVFSAGTIDAVWSAASGAEWYRIEKSTDCGETWTVVAETTERNCRIEGLENGKKMHLRVRGMNSDRMGNASWDYPVYVTDQIPYAVDGLRVWKGTDGYDVSWGQQLGVSEYCLYRRRKCEDEFHLVYRGKQPFFHDNTVGAWEYAASAVNGNGEGPLSAVRNTDENGLSNWDPQPEIPFRRYLPSHEYGYQGFDFLKSYGIQEEPVYPK